MAMSIIEAIKLVRQGEAAEYIDRFIGIVKYSASTGQDAPFAFDDALVVAMALTRLAESADGRKLLGLPKRKNTQYKAEDFRPGSSQFRLAVQYRQGKIAQKEAIDALASSLDPSPDLRTATRLLDDLAGITKRLQDEIERNVDAIISSGEEDISREDALRTMIVSIAGPQPIEPLRQSIERSGASPARKRELLDGLRKIFE